MVLSTTATGLIKVRENPSPAIVNSSAVFSGVRICLIDLAVSGGSNGGASASSNSIYMESGCKM